MTLPTGGWTDYTYQQYSLRMRECGTSAWGDLPVGIRSKTTSEGGTWDYVHSFGKNVPVEPSQTCGTNDANQPIASLPPVRWARTTVLSPAIGVTNDATPSQTVLMRTRTDHYFDVWTGGGFDPLLGSWSHGSVAVFGQPGVLGAPAATADQNGVTPGGSALADVDVRRTVDGQQQWLTTRTFENCANDRSGNCSATSAVPGRLVRSEYLRWAPARSTSESGRTMELLGSRLVTSSSTVYDSDTGCGGTCATAVIHDPDQRNGAGLSRQSTFKSNFPGSQDVVTFTNYPSWTAAELKDAAGDLSGTKKWRFDTYSEKKRTVSSVSERSFYCFSVDGFLERVRTLAGASPGTTDTVRQFTRSGNGEVASESSYGADDFDGTGTQSVGAPQESAICTAALPQTPLYRIDYDYTAGLLRRAEYDSPSVVTLDRTIEPISGFVTADRDVSGIATTYSYESDTGRLKEIDPPGDAKISLTYKNATSASAGATVDVVTTAGAVTLQKEHVAFDGLGRPRRESRWLPAETSSSSTARWITTETKYDGLGRKRSVSVPTATTGTSPPSSGFSSSVKVTTSEYDASGRPARIVGPDGSVVRTSWTGNRVARRSSTIAGAGGESNVEVIEEYDAEGRLVSVEEGSGAPTAEFPHGSLVETSYAYDAGGRLKSVDAGEPQERLFTYDSRGFLTTEDHPESGVTTCLYDARGHARKRTSGGRTLAFTFDGAERLTTVAEGDNVVKELTFGSANSGTNMLQGKLLSARRRNLLSTGTYDVTETYAYDTAPPSPRAANPAGRMSQRTTVVEQVNGSTRTKLQTFTYTVDYDSLGGAKSLVMPSCSLNGCSAASGLTTVDFTRNGGLLTSVANFATLTYHPSGMVEKVTHASTASPLPADTYSAINGIARPSAIQFTGGTCPTPNPSSIVSAAAVCASATNNTASVTPRANIVHSWQIAGGGTITSPLIGDSITFTVPPSGTVTLTVTATDSCSGTAASSKSINVTAAPAAPVISVQSPLCNGAGRTASVPQVAGVTYTWTISGGAITSSTSGSEIEFTTSASSVTLNVSAQSSCGTTAAAPKTVTVIASPSAQLTSANTTIVRGAGSALLSVSLSGASPRTIVWSDGVQQSNITTSTITRSVSPSVTTGYSLASVTAGGCAGSVSGTTTVTVIPAGPASVTATTQENRTVLVTWTAVTGAASYRIERAPRVGAGTTWSVVTTSTSYLDTVPASTAPVTYVYYVRTVAADGEFSDRGAWDYATAATLLYQRPQLVATSTAIAAVDVSELRAGVDALRAAVSLPPLLGGAAPLTGVLVRAADFTDVIAAMNAARTAMSRSPFAYAGVPAPAAGGAALAAHVVQIREALR